MTLFSKSLQGWTLCWRMMLCLVIFLTGMSFRFHCQTNNVWIGWLVCINASLVVFFPGITSEVIIVQIRNFSPFAIEYCIPRAQWGLNESVLRRAQGFAWIIRSSHKCDSQRHANLWCIVYCFSAVGTIQEAQHDCHRIFYMSSIILVQLFLGYTSMY